MELVESSDKLDHSRGINSFQEEGIELMPDFNELHRFAITTACFQNLLNKYVSDANQHNREEKRDFLQTIEHDLENRIDYCNTCGDIICLSRYCPTLGFCCLGCPLGGFLCYQHPVTAVALCPLYLGCCFGYTLGQCMQNEWCNTPEKKLLRKGLGRRNIIMEDEDCCHSDKPDLLNLSEMATNWNQLRTITQEGLRRLDS